MPDRPQPAPRPTRALLQQRENQLYETTARLVAVEAELLDANERLAASHVQRDQMAARTEPEAAAIALCVKALDEMGAEQAAMQRRQSTYRGTPDSSSTERVLLYLAHRYGVPLMVRPEPDPEPDEGADIVFAPPAVARKLERALQSDPFLLDRLR